MTIGSKDKECGISTDIIFFSQRVCIGIPAFYGIIVFCGSIQLDPYADKFIIEIVSGFFFWKKLFAHIFTGAAPGGKAVHKDIFVLCFGFGLYGRPAEAVFKVYAFFLGLC